MDKTEEYIKMCESAKEIQKSWQPDVGDWFLNDYRGTTGFPVEVEKQIWDYDDKDKWEKIQCLTYKPSIKEYVVISDSDGSHTYSMSEFFKHRHVFLPSQDYLQKILIEKSYTGCDVFVTYLHDFMFPEQLCTEDDVCDKCSELGSSRRKMYHTMEQWTLALTMDELYDKKWNGSEWIESD